MSNLSARVAKWDNVKAILIFLVVFGHSLSPFIPEVEIAKYTYVWFTTFHMPLFLFITGLFSKSFVNAPKLNTKKIASYVLLFFYMKFLIYITMLIIKGRARYSFISENGTPWYIFVTAVFMVITFYLKNCNPKKVFLVSLALALIVGFVKEIGDTFMLSRIFVYFPYFYLGYALDRNKVLEFTDKKFIRIASVFVFIGFTVAVFALGDRIYSIRYCLTGNNPYAEFGRFSNFGILIRIGCYILSSVISLAVLSIIPKRKIPVVTGIGAKTLTIYAVHRPLQRVFNHTLLPFVVGVLPPWAIIPAFLVISAVLTFVLSLKPFDYIIYPCTKSDKWLVPFKNWLKK